MHDAGMPEAEVAKLRFDDSRLHHVVAKCGVFAETDIVILSKAVFLPQKSCSCGCDSDAEFVRVNAGEYAA